MDFARFLFTRDFADILTFETFYPTLIFYLFFISGIYHRDLRDWWPVLQH